MNKPVGFSEMFPYYQIVTAITVVLTLLPLPAHWRAGNTATISLGLWNFGGNLICLVNTLVWRGNMKNPYPVWGDITALYYGNMGTAISSCTLCIVYRLWRVARTQTVLTTRQDKRRQNYLTYFLCIGLPLIQAGLHFIVQGHRYNIFEDLGPMTTTYQTWVTFIAYFLIEPAVTFISAIFCALTIRIFLKQRKDFDAIFGSQSGHINKDRYVRLLLLGAVGISIHLPISTIVVIVNATVFTTYPWISWEDTHSNFGRIAYFNRFIVDSTPYSKSLIELSFSLVPAAGITYFCFFGFGEEATRQYKIMIGALLKPFGIKYPKEKKRRTIKKTWLDVLFCRPGRPINLTSSAQSSSIPDFATNHASSRNSRPSNRSQPHSQSARGDFGLDIDNLDFLDAAEARKQARISAYTRPGQAARSAARTGGRRDRRDSIDSSIHGANDTDEEDEKAEETSSSANSSINDKDKLPREMDITEQPYQSEQQPEQLNEKAEPITTEPKEKHITIAEEPNRDLEAQHEIEEVDEHGNPIPPPELVVARQEFRSRHPDWTEAITF